MSIEEQLNINKNQAFTTSVELNHLVPPHLAEIYADELSKTEATTALDIINNKVLQKKLLEVSVTRNFKNTMIALKKNTDVLIRYVHFREHNYIKIIESSSSSLGIEIYTPNQLLDIYNYNIDELENGILTFTPKAGLHDNLKIGSLTATLHLNINKHYIADLISTIPALFTGENANYLKKINSKRDRLDRAYIIKIIST